MWPDIVDVKALTGNGQTWRRRPHPWRQAARLCHTDRRPAAWRGERASAGDVGPAGLSVPWRVPLHCLPFHAPSNGMLLALFKMSLIPARPGGSRCDTPRTSTTIESWWAR